MADLKLSDKSITTSSAAGYVHIIIPDAGSPSGFTSYRIAVSSLHSSLQSQISGNALDIFSLNSRVTSVENVQSRAQFKAKTSAFQFSQPADSNLVKITVKTFSTGSVKIGTSSGGDEILSLTTLTSADDTDLTLDIDKYSRLGQTIYFTITGTVSANVYYTKNEYE